MTDPLIQQTPTPVGNWNGGEVHSNRYSRRSIARKLPPYGKLLATDILMKPWQSIFIFTGSDGWNYASETSMKRPRVALPYSDNPQQFKWDIKGRDCVVLSYGQPEPKKNLLSLARCLLESGAPFVALLCPEVFGNPITTIRPAS